MRTLLRVHVLLALLGGIGREAFAGEFYGHSISSAVAGEKNKACFVAENPPLQQANKLLS
jgi:hypothetical protein